MAKTKTQVTLSGNEAVKRRRLNDTEQSVNYKPKCINYVWLLYNQVCTLIKPNTKDIFLSVAIFNQVAAIHNAARQTLNGVGEMAEKYTANTEPLRIYGKDYNVNRSEMVKYPAEAAKQVGLEFKKKAEWLGTAQTVITLIEMFGERISEIRIGVDELIVSKGTDGTKVTKVSLFGISPRIETHLPRSEFQTSY